MAIPLNKSTLSKYRTLIQNLPWKEQAFETKRSTWRKEESGHRGFADFCRQSFDGETLKLSRFDLIQKGRRNFEHALFCTVLWGYPRNMRGNSFQKVLTALPIIKSVFPSRKQLYQKDFWEILEKLSRTGVGLSTLTKLLYFLGYSLEGHKCIILDQRIIDTLNAQIFSELSAFNGITTLNKNSFYISYIAKMEEIAIAEGYQVDQLELFLFQFGKNLKEPVGNTEISAGL